MRSIAAQERRRPPFSVRASGVSTIRACQAGPASCSRSLLRRSSPFLGGLPRRADRSVAVDRRAAVRAVEVRGRGAVGLLVPGAGSTVSRERALASLVRGRVVSSLVGLDGDIVLQLATKPAETTIYVSLPAGRNAPQRRPLSRSRSSGPATAALLTSGSTRIDGLVSLADVAPTAKAIAAGKQPRIRARADADAAATLARLDTRLTRAHDARTGATLVLVGWLVAFSALGILARVAIAGPGRGARRARRARDGALAARSRRRTTRRPSSSVLAVVTGAGALAPRRSARHSLPVAVTCFLAVFLVVLAAWPDVNALAAIGPHPDGGGRFYGVTNQVETLLLPPALAAAASVGVAGAAAIGLLLLVTVGWSRAGADGGGIVVVAAAWAVLLAGLARVRLTPARVALGVARRRRARAPRRRRRRAARRLEPRHGRGRRRARGRSSTTSTGAFASPGTAPRRPPTWRSSACSRSAASSGSGSGGGDGRPCSRCSPASRVSLLVNDTPVDVLGYGALGCLALTAWEETRAPEAITERSAASRLPEPQERPAH